LLTLAAMPLRGKKLGLLISVAPGHPNFNHGVRLAKTALARGVDVYLYCIDEAVNGLSDPRVQQLKVDGLKLFACAYGAQRRKIPMSELATFSGLAIVNDFIAGTDRFVSFN
jgi:DsrE/DsrF-like family